MNTGRNLNIFTVHTRCHDTQHNGAQHDNIQHNDTQHDNIQLNDSQHNDTRHYNKKRDTQRVVSLCLSVVAPIYTLTMGDFLGKLAPSCSKLFQIQGNFVNLQ
jgi:hypothetical protein